MGLSANVHLEFFEDKDSTVSTEQLEDDILKKMLMMVDELVARKPGSALVYFGHNLTVFLNALQDILRLTIRFLTSQ